MHMYLYSQSTHKSPRMTAGHNAHRSSHMLTHSMLCPQDNRSFSLCCAGVKMCVPMYVRLLCRAAMLSIQCAV